MKPRHKCFGPFPSLTEEEVMTENDLPISKINLDKSVKKWDTLISDISVRLDDTNTRNAAIADFYELVNLLIKCSSKTRKRRGLLAMKKLGNLRRIGHDIAFPLAIKCVRKNDCVSFAAIIELFKMHPMGLELTQFRLTGGERLGHLAALLDHITILRCIHRIDPNSLERLASTGDSVAHTACRFGSVRCIKFLEKVCPGLFALRNSLGQSPRDLTL